MTKNNLPTFLTTTTPLFIIIGIITLLFFTNIIIANNHDPQPQPNELYSNTNNNNNNNNKIGTFTSTINTTKFLFGGRKTIQEIIQLLRNVTTFNYINGNNNKKNKVNEDNKEINDNYLLSKYFNMTWCHCNYKNKSLQNTLQNTLQNNNEINHLITRNEICIVNNLTFYIISNGYNILQFKNNFELIKIFNNETLLQKNLIGYLPTNYNNKNFVIIGPNFALDSYFDETFTTITKFFTKLFYENRTIFKIVNIGEFDKNGKGIRIINLNSNKCFTTFVNSITNKINFKGTTCSTLQNLNETKNENEIKIYNNQKFYWTGQYLIPNLSLQRKSIDSNNYKIEAIAITTTLFSYLLNENENLNVQHLQFLNVNDFINNNLYNNDYNKDFYNNNLLNIEDDRLFYEEMELIVDDERLQGELLLADIPLRYSSGNSYYCFNYLLLLSLLLVLTFV
ncbi:hypothetical protein ABK040_002241 [Willaertia magna]